jgi:WD40 repeat protein
VSVEDRLRAAALDLNASVEDLELVERLRRFPERRRRQARRRVAAALAVPLLLAAALGLAALVRTPQDKAPPVTPPHPGPTVPAPGQGLAPTLLPTPAIVHAVAFSPDGTTLVSADGGRNLYLWDVARRVRTATIRNPTHSMFSLAFSRSGLLASCGGGQEISLWDITRKARIATMQNPHSGAWAPAFSPDGSVLAVSQYAVGTTLWDTTRHTLIATLATQGQHGGRTAFSPDGTKLASVNGGHQISLWDVARHTRIGSMTTAAWAQDVAFAPDGRTLIVVEATNGQGSKITMWDTRRGTRTATLPGTTSARLTRITLSPNGKLLAVRDNGSVRLWDLANRKQVAVLPATGDPDYDLAFSPDGHRLAATGKFEILLWQLPPRLTG